MHGRFCPDPFRMRDAKRCKALKAFNYRLIYLELGRKIRVASLREHVVLLFLRWRKDTVILKAVALNVPKLGLRILLVVAALEKMLHPSRPRGVVDVSHPAGCVHALALIDPLDLRFHMLQPIHQKGVARRRY